MFEHKQSFDTFVATQLNHEQKTAVQAKDGSFLVIAGAGSGKTRVITARITNLILNHNVEPSSIIALTFTNKAAQEMQHRIEQFLPTLRTKPTIATFHAYCLKLLKKHHFLNNLPDFSVIDAQDAHKLLQSIVKEKGLEKLFNSKQLLSFFSNFTMNETLKLEEPMWNMHHAQQFMELYNAYQQQKRLSNYLDFDDLLYKTYELFTKNPEFQTRHMMQHRHVLVDEYQDTNLIQHELLKQMTQLNKILAVDSVCAVGDEDQSIYSWRGANVSNILEFHNEFLGTQKIKLEQNYRSTQQILDIANHVIKHNTDRNHKQLWSANTKEHQPLLLECLSDLQEAALIAQLIHLLSKQQTLNSIAILYRTHYQSRIIEEALIKENIAYKMIGGISFYERKEIKDLLAYLRLIINPFDRISLFRVINCPARGLGEKFEEQFIQTWTQNPFCNWQEIAHLLISENLLAKKQENSLQEFLNFFNNLNALFEKKEQEVSNILQHFIKVTGYLSYLNNSFEKIEAEEKRENVAEFLRAAAYFDENQKTGLSQFLDEISLMQEMIKQDDSKNARVNMMTLHSAKGLEFDTVLLVGLEEGLLPSSQSIGQENVQEERRLFYVGITRAREKLFISHSKYRNTFGKLDQQRPSRFLQEIPRNAMLEQEAAHWSKSSFITFLQEWISSKSPKTIKKKDASSEIKPESTSSFSPTIKRLQSVKHETFGLGIAHNVEQKGNKIFVTVHFTHHGTKKIESSFLKVV